MTIALALVFACAAHAFPPRGGSAQPTYHAFGDSITGDQNVGGTLECGHITDSSLNCYIEIINAVEFTKITNFGISGDQACDTADRKVFPNENPQSSGNPVYTEMIGTNDANLKGVGAYEVNYNACHQASLYWLGIPSSSKVSATACTQTGTWSADATYPSGVGLQTATNGATLACPLTIGSSGVAVCWYRLFDSGGGTFTYSVDAGSTTTVNSATTTPISTQNGSTHGEAIIRITGLSAGSHIIHLTTTSTSTVSSAGCGTPAASKQSSVVLALGVPFQQNDTSSAATAEYNTDALANATQAANDGLNVIPVPIRSCGPGGIYSLNSTTDMFNQLHPGASGHLHLAQCVESYWQHPK